ncbi:MAG TPA: hypothetical protein VLD37_06275 [Candidatus Bilamarchaeum sp.]|nr:hypothetical protein [Candidatus Bilamarchaeum sp.]
MEIAKTRIYALPIILIALWEALYIAIDVFYPSGGGKITLGAVLFFTEFAVLFAIPLYLGGRLSKKDNLPLQAIAVNFAAFFAVFLILGTCGTLVSLRNGGLDSLASALAFFLVLSLVKAAIGLAGLIIGAYLHKALPWPWEKYQLALFVLCGLCVGGVLALSYLAGTALESSIGFESSPDYSDTLENCAIGQWTRTKVLGLEITMTVDGITTYRGRQACHSGGATSAYGSDMRMDMYAVEKGDYCIVTNTTGKSGQKSSEECRGYWPGYVATN